MPESVKSWTIVNAPSNANHYNTETVKPQANVLNLRKRILSFKKSKDIETDKNQKITTRSNIVNESNLQTLKRNIAQANTQRDQLIKKNSQGQFAATPRSALPSDTSDRRLRESQRGGLSRKRSQMRDSVENTDEKNSKRLLKLDDNRSLGSHCLVHGVVRDDKFLTRTNKLKSEANTKYLEIIQ